MKCSKVKIRRRKKQLFVERFGGKCQQCGYNKSLNSLDFHHINPNEKEYSISKMMDWSNDRIEKEIVKCILVCKNCHGEIHDDEYNYDIKINYNDWILITCEFCGKEFKTTRNSRKYCSQKCSSLSQRKTINRPTKNELRELISNNTWVDIGRMFNVSDNTIRKWSKQYNLI